MAKITPFKAIRPPREKVHLVASRSYVSYTPSGLRWKLNTNPFTFIHIINPDYQERGRKARGIEKFKKVRSKFREFLDDGVFQKDERDTFYLYKQVGHGNTFTGIIAGAAVDDYTHGYIRKHEETIAIREMMFKDYLKTTGFNAEPVLLTYPDKPGLEELIARYESTRAEYEFATADTSVHYLWPITNASDIEFIQDYFAQITHLYIADGHHRSASSALLTEEIRAEIDHYSGQEKFNYFMSYLIPESQLKIESFYRLMKDIGGLQKSQLVKLLSEKFHIDTVSGPFVPNRKHQFSMYTDGQWFELNTKSEFIHDETPVGDLDSQILTDLVLKPFFGVTDLRHDKRVTFIPGYEEPSHIQHKVDKGKAEVAFGMYPVTIEQLKKVSDCDGIMPPKSTYIEPKLRSGLTIYDINEE